MSLDEKRSERTGARNGEYRQDNCGQGSLRPARDSYLAAVTTLQIPRLAEISELAAAAITPFRLGALDATPAIETFVQFYFRFYV